MGNNHMQACDAITYAFPKCIKFGFSEIVIVKTYILGPFTQKYLIWWRLNSWSKLYYAMLLSP